MTAGEENFAGLYPTLAALLDDGIALGVHAEPGLRIASLSDGPDPICMFFSDGMSADEVFGKLESLAVRYEEEGIVTDEVNGTEYLR